MSNPDIIELGAAVLVKDEHYSRRLRALARTSASQIDLYERCARSWFIRYIEGVETPSTPAQLRGTSIHSLVEDSLRAGALTEPDHEHAPIVRDGMKLWPDRVGKEWVVEQKIDMPTLPGGPVVVGYVDLATAWRETGTAQASDGESFQYDSLRVDVWDHKSTSDFRYCKTESELLENTQMVTYAKWAYDVVGADLVRVGHLYYRTKMPPRSRAVGPVDFPRDRMLHEWQKRLAVVGQMVRDAKETPDADHALPLGPSTGECDKYGGCPHRARCGFDTLNLGAKQMTNGPSLLDQLMQATGQQPQQTLPVPRPEQPPAAPGYVPTQPTSVNPNHAHPSAVGVAGYTPGQECNGRGYYASSNGQGFINVEPGHMCKACVGPQTVRPGQIVPPDAPPRESTPAEIQAVEAGKKRGRPKKKAMDPGEVMRLYGELNEKRGFSIQEVERLIKEDAVEDALSGKITPGMLRQPAALPQAAPAPTLPPPPTTAMQGVPAVPANANHPSQEQIPSAPTLQTAQEQWYANSGPPPANGSNETTAPPVIITTDAVVRIPPAVTAAMQAPLPPPAPAAIPRPPANLVMYVDCAPVKGGAGAVLLDEWLAPIAIAAAQGFIDRETGKPKPYSDWRFIPYVSKAVLADAIRTALPTLPPVVVVLSSSGGADVFQEVVTPWAAQIVRPMPRGGV